MDSWSYVNVNAHIKILKLRVNQRIDSYATNARLERSGSHRDTIADFKRGLLPINRAYLRILNQSCAAVGEQRTHVRRTDRHLEIGGVQIRQRVQIDRPI